MKSEYENVYDGRQGGKSKRVRKDLERDWNPLPNENSTNDFLKMYSICVVVWMLIILLIRRAINSRQFS